MVLPGRAHGLVGRGVLVILKGHLIQPFGQSHRQRPDFVEIVPLATLSLRDEVEGGLTEGTASKSPGLQSRGPACAPMHIPPHMHAHCGSGRVPGACPGHCHSPEGSFNLRENIPTLKGASLVLREPR